MHIFCQSRDSLFHQLDVCCLLNSFSVLLAHNPVNTGRLNKINRTLQNPFFFFFFATDMQFNMIRLNRSATRSIFRQRCSVVPEAVRGYRCICTRWSVTGFLINAVAFKPHHHSSDFRRERGRNDRIKKGKT